MQCLFVTLHMQRGITINLALESRLCHVCLAVHCHSVAIEMLCKQISYMLIYFVTSQMLKTQIKHLLTENRDLTSFLQNIRVYICHTYDIKIIMAAQFNNIVHN